jgi:hypothetical protein
LSAASKGREREIFVDKFLANVFPPIYRFGTGDATDLSGKKSGQLDVVVEHPFAPSLPAVGGTDVRLYPAEAVAAVVEVKSDVAAQWAEAVGTAGALKQLTRSFGARLTLGGVSPSPDIPLVAVGYKGWKDIESARARLNDSQVDAILVIDSGIFVASEGTWAREDLALWAMISFLFDRISRLSSASTFPFGYLGV